MKTKAKDQIRLPDGRVMTLKEAFDAGLVKPIEQRYYAPPRYFARTFDFDENVSWEIGKTLYLSWTKAPLPFPTREEPMRLEGRRKVSETRGHIPGTHHVARRIANAEERFIEFARETAGLSQDEAILVLGVYRKERAIKIDPVTGQFTFTHGGFAEPDVLRRAAGYPTRPRRASRAQETSSTDAYDDTERIQSGIRASASKLRAVKPITGKLTSSQERVLQRFDGYELPFISNPIIYGFGYERMSAYEHKTLIALVLGGQMRVLRVSGPLPGNHPKSKVGAHAHAHYKLQAMRR